MTPELITTLAQALLTLIDAYEQAKGKPFDINECTADAKASSERTASDNAAVDSEIDKRFPTG